MSDIKLNFTGKASFEEKNDFEKFYEELWKRTPHYNADWPSDEEIENKKRGLIFNPPFHIRVVYFNHSKASSSVHSVPSPNPLSAVAVP